MREIVTYQSIKENPKNARDTKYQSIKKKPKSARDTISISKRKS